jgi:hypothetical protein
MHSGKYRNHSHNFRHNKFTLETPTPGKTSKRGLFIQLRQIQKMITISAKPWQYHPQRKFGLDLSRSETMALSLGLLCFTALLFCKWCSCGCCVGAHGPTIWPDPSWRGYAIAPSPSGLLLQPQIRAPTPTSRPLTTITTFTAPARSTQPLSPAPAHDLVEYEDQ